MSWLQESRKHLREQQLAPEAWLTVTLDGGRRVYRSFAELDEETRVTVTFVAIVILFLL